MPSDTRTRGILIALLAAIFAAALMSVLGHTGGMQIPAAASEAVRWIAIGLLAVYATLRRSLTVWIVTGMAAGVEMGYDAPNTAIHFQVLGSIFLRLIKVIIAPLLFGTLVVGIASHADLKKVGRLALKSLLYFELVSTLAMLIGFAAINLSRAGYGVRLPASTESLNVAPHTATQLI